MSNETEKSGHTKSDQDRRCTYFKITYGKLTDASGKPTDDGASLTSQCYEALGDKDNPPRFPPKLLILWVSPNFYPQLEDLQQLLTSIRDTSIRLGSLTVPLIGSTVSACVYDGHSHEQGAILICLASRFVDAKVAVSPSAETDPHGAVAELIQGLQIADDRDTNTTGNRFLMTFLPGFTDEGEAGPYVAPEIVQGLREQTFGRLPMFGGVSSVRGPLGRGFQIIDDRARTGSAVAALVTSPFCHGIRVSTGLTISDKTPPYRVKRVADEGHSITAFYEGSPREVLATIGSDSPNLRLLGIHAPGGERLVTLPVLRNDHLCLHRPADNLSTMYVLEADPSELLAAAIEDQHKQIKQMNVDDRKVAGILGIECTARLRHGLGIGNQMDGAIQSGTAGRRDCSYVGCFMDGEIGVDDRGQSVLQNWSLSQAVFAAEASVRQSVYSSDFETIARFASSAAAAKTAQIAMELLLECVEELSFVPELGFQGGMVSLILQDRGERWIVAQVAKGPLWISQVLPRTRRRLTDDDVLSQVARNKSPVYVRDATTDPRCDQKAARAARVFSFYALPLMDEKDEVIGILQIDLGDRRDQIDLAPDDLKILSALQKLATGPICRVIKTEEWDVARKFNSFLTDCLECKTINEALVQFACNAVAEMGAHGHVRLLLPESKKLRLLGGIGPYFDAAWWQRRTIGLDDGSPSAECVRSRQSKVTNDAAHDPDAAGIRMRYDNRSAVGESLWRIRAYANHPLVGSGGQVVGVLNVCSDQPWFFTPSRQRSLENISRCVTFLLTHFQRQQSERTGRDELSFLYGIVSNLERVLDTRAALQDEINRTKQAARADVVSCFLWSEVQDRFVLRAQVGWHDERWVDAAWYSKDEGLPWFLTPTLPYYCEDLSAHSEARGEKYEIPMLGHQVSSSQNYEMIVLPLRSQEELLGVITMHRKKNGELADFASGFATTNPTTLYQATRDLSGLIASLIRHDKTEKREAQMRRISSVNDILLKGWDHPLGLLLSGFCEGIVEQFNCRSCAVFLVDHGRRLLRLVAKQELVPRSLSIPASVGPGPDPLWVAFENASRKEIRLPTSKTPTSILDASKDNLLDRVFVPLIVDHRPIGVLVICWSVPQPFLGCAVYPHYSPEVVEDFATHLAAVIHQRIKADRVMRLERSLRAERSLRGMIKNLETNQHSLGKATQIIRSGLNRLARRNPAFQEAQIIAETRKAVDDLASIINGTKKVGHHLSETKRGVFPINKLLLEALAYFHDETINNGVAVDTAAVTAVDVSVYGMQMLECFSTVIDNAIKSMPSGGKLTLVVRKRLLESDCEVLISDTGTGMEPNMIDMVLRGEVESTKDQGAGVGLFLARLYVEGHGGRLVVESVPGKGTTVILLLPLSETADEYD